MHGIQKLIASIRVSHVRRYLTSRGWTVVDGVLDSRIYFQGPVIDDGGDPIVVTVPRHEEDAKFRGRLHQMVIALCEVERREPMQIVRDIASTKPYESSADSADSAEATRREFRFRVRNTRRGPLRLQVADSGTTVSLASSEALLVVVADGRPPDIEYGEDSIVLSAADGARLFGLFDEEQFADGSPTNVSGIVREELERRRESIEGYSDLTERLRPLLKRVEFDSPAADADNPSMDPRAVQRLAAVVAVGLARSARPVSTARTVVWRVVGRLLIRAEMALELRDESESELHAVAARDDQSAPLDTLRWLHENSITVGAPRTA